MFFTGISRLSGQIATAQVRATKEKTAELLEMKQLVDSAEQILVQDGDIAEFGRLLDYAWSIKRGLTSEISSEYIDDIYQRAKKAGALGGKLLGTVQ